MSADTTTDSDERPAPITDVSRSDGCSPIASEPLPDSRPMDEFEELDVRSIGLSRIVNAITFAVIGSVVLVVGSVLLWGVPFPWKLIVPLVWLFFAGLCSLNVVW